MRLFNRKFRLSMILLAVTILLIFLHFLGWLAPIEQIVVRALSPIQHRLYLTGNLINNIYQPDELTGPNPQTREEISSQRDALLIQNAQLKILLAEYQAIDEQFDYLSDRGFSAISARIIGKGFQSDAQILIIDKGWQDGIQIGLPVVVRRGMVVAKVLEVDRYSSKILLIDDSQSSLVARIQNESEVQGVVVGERGLSMKMELIPEGQPVNLGDVVVTSGLEESTPAGLLIGTVERIEGTENSFFHTIFVKPLVDFNDLIVVSVLTSQTNE